MKNENQMTPETYLPITPATRIPFPCKLKHRNGHTLYFPDVAAFTAEELLLSGDWTHYCTSVTEPVGRPGDCSGLHCDNCAPEFYCWNGKSTCNKQPISAASQSVELIIRETERMVGETYHMPTPPRDAVIRSLATQVFLARKSHPAVPTASGATGEANENDGFDEWWMRWDQKGMACNDAELMARDAWRHSAKRFTASRPAVAQEGVRDTARLDWLEAHGAGLNDADSPPGPHVWVELMGEIKHFHEKSYRAAIDAAMSSQPEGRG